MTPALFDQGWEMLKAALGYVPPEATRIVYRRALEDIPDENWIAGIAALIASPDFGQLYAVPRVVPCIGEIRDECAAKAPPPPMTPERLEWRARYMAEQYGEHKHLPSPGNTGHAGLLRLINDPDEFLRVFRPDRLLAPIAEPQARITEEEWNERVRALLKQAEEGK